MIWGAEEIDKKSISEALLQEKKLEKLTKKGFPRGKNWRGYHEEKINSFSYFPATPRSLMVDP